MFDVHAQLFHPECVLPTPTSLMPNATTSGGMGGMGGMGADPHAGHGH